MCVTVVLKLGRSMAIYLLLYYLLLLTAHPEKGLIGGGEKSLKSLKQVVSSK